MPNEGYSNEIKTFGKQQKNHLVAKKETLVMIASFIELDIQCITWLFLSLLILDSIHKALNIL